MAFYIFQKILSASTHLACPRAPIGIFTYISYTYIGEIKNDTLGLNLKATDTPKISETPIIPDTGIFGRKKAQFLSPLGAESVYFGRKCLFRPKYRI